MDELSFATSNMQVPAVSARPLSPVLKGHRHFKRKRNICINLSQRFKSQSDTAIECNPPKNQSSFKSALTAVERIKNIERIERERQEMYDFLSEPLTPEGEYEFKKPLPVQEASSVKSNDNILDVKNEEISQMDTSITESQLSNAVDDALATYETDTAAVYINPSDQKEYLQSICHTEQIKENIRSLENRIKDSTRHNDTSSCQDDDGKASYLSLIDSEPNTAKRKLSPGCPNPENELSVKKLKSECSEMLGRSIRCIEEENRIEISLNNNLRLNIEYQKDCKKIETKDIPESLTKSSSEEISSSQIYSCEHINLKADDSKTCRKCNRVKIKEDSTLTRQNVDKLDVKKAKENVIDNIHSSADYYSRKQNNIVLSPNQARNNVYTVYNVNEIKNNADYIRSPPAKAPKIDRKLKYEQNINKTSSKINKDLTPRKSKDYDHISQKECAPKLIEQQSNALHRQDKVNENIFLQKRCMESLNLHNQVVQNVAMHNKKKGEVYLQDKLPIKMSKLSETETSSVPSSSDTFVGFVSGYSKKAVKISELALGKAKMLAKECYESFISPPGSETASTNKIDKDDTKNITSNDKATKLGLSTGSGKALQSKNLNKAAKFFNDIQNDTNNQNNTNKSKHSDYENSIQLKSSGFKSGSGRALKIPENFLNQAKTLSNEVHNESSSSYSSKTTKNTPKTCNFKSSAGKVLKIEESLLNKAQKIHDDSSSSFASENTKNTDVFKGFATGAGKALKINENSLKNAKKLQNEVLNLPNHSEQSKTSNNFKSAAGKTLKINESLLKKARNMENDTASNNTTISDVVNCGQSVRTHEFMSTTGTCKPITVSEKTLLQVKNLLLEDINSQNNTRSNVMSQKSSTVISESKYILKNDESQVPNEVLEKALAVYDSVKDYHRKTENNKDDHTLKAAVSFFDAEDSQKSFRSKSLVEQSNLDGIETLKSPCSVSNISSTSSSSIFMLHKDKSSTPVGIKRLRPKSYYLKGSKEALQAAKATFSNIMQDGHSTPVKANNTITTSTPNCFNRNIMPVQNFNSTLTPIKYDGKLPVDINEKGDAFIIMQEPIDSSKEVKERLQKEYQQLKQKMEVICKRWESLDEQLKIIENKEESLRRVFSDVDQHVDKIELLDGASIVLNKDYIGFYEIKNAFLAMPGVDDQKLPISWLENHYRMVVWKLNLYNNTYGRNWDVLNVENVISQLKYRYDRDIYQCHRSVIRQIFEKDSSASVKMVLCVSDIIQDKENIELELTDGWYRVKTQIDQALSSQVTKQNIILGTKLIIQGAELISHTACHPLESAESDRLTIHYNGTRKAKCHQKLGKEIIQSPFILSMRSFEITGGVIQCLKIVVARVYPLTFVEKTNDCYIFRNEKAELKKQFEYETQFEKEVDKARQAVLVELQNETKRLPKIKTIDEYSDAETIYEYYKQNFDPDGATLQLTKSQMDKINKFQEKLINEQETRLRLELEAKLSHVTRRNVSTDLKLLILDEHCDVNNHIILSIWNPAKILYEKLKENHVYLLHNVIPKLYGLTATRNTFVKQLSKEPVAAVQRSLTKIDTLLAHRPIFNQFDTAGIVVETIVNDYEQTLFLASETQLILVVKIHNGVDRTCLLSGLAAGDVIIAVNLVYGSPLHGFAHAIANNQTLIKKNAKLNYLEDYCQLLSNVPANFFEKVWQDVQNYEDACKNVSSASKINFDTTDDDIEEAMSSINF